MVSSRYKPEIGQRFGSGVVTDNEIWIYRADGTRAHGARLQCDCGNIYTAIWNTLKPEGSVLSCGCRYAQTRQEGGLNRRKPAPPGMKFCTGCDNFHALTNFGTDSRASDGLQSISRACFTRLLRETGRSKTHGNTRRARKLTAQVADPVPGSIYLKVLASGPCVYCGKAAETVDHITPLARGGHEAEHNLVPACTSCNSSKGKKLLAEWDQARVTQAMACSLKVCAQSSFQRPQLT